MCLAVPGKIVSIKENVAVVDYGSEERTGRIIEGEYQIGDYVILQGGIVIEKIPEKEAEESLAMYQEALEEDPE